MDEMVDSVVPIRPTRCPRCGKEIIFKPNDKYEYPYECPDCGELYYDKWLGIWRIYRPPEED